MKNDLPTTLQTKTCRDDLAPCLQVSYHLKLDVGLHVISRTTSNVCSIGVSHYCSVAFQLTSRLEVCDLSLPALFGMLDPHFRCWVLYQSFKTRSFVHWICNCRKTSGTSGSKIAHICLTEVSLRKQTWRTWPGSIQFTARQQPE